MIVVTAEQMRRLDAATIGAGGVPGVLLMENAGRAVVEAIAARGPVAGVRIVVVCGAGNNGGDGFVVARHLHDRGAQVAMLLVAGEPLAARVADARVHFDAAVRAGVKAIDAGPEGFAAAAPFISAADIVVDAILGTGAGRTVGGHLADVIRRVNAAPGRRIAVDVPSGLDADRGQALGACVRADATITFAFAKLGLVTAPGFTFCGQLTVADIGIPARLVAERTTGVDFSARLLDEACFTTLAVPRHALSHKGTFGHLVVVAGSREHPGAAVMCGEAAMRAGAGLVTIVSTEETERALAGRVVEVSIASLGPQPSGAEDGDAAWARLEDRIEGTQAVAFGPGVARTGGMRRVLERLLESWEGPLLIDADGLNLLAEDPAALASTRAQVVLTPHPAEMGRLARVPTATVQADRVAVARDFARSHRAVVVLKGARTVIAAPNGSVSINPTGNPGMAGGGTGDALTGTIGALLANRLLPIDAACAGTFLHGRAGDLARDTVGEVGLLARDLIAHLPAARRSLGSR